LNAAASIGDWLGRTRRDEDEVTLGAVQRLAATLDHDPNALRRRDELPESWYVILFGSVARQSALGRDGHPETGDFLPPLAGMRRMFGGRRTRFIAPLKIGDLVSRVSTVTRAESKSGGTGPFILVTVTHEISGPFGPAVTEEQDIIYRAPVGAGVAAPQRKAAPLTEVPAWSKPAWSKSIELDPALIFRYSALTFNAHRIHYDLPYARDVEGYPGLVINGGLIALLLIESARPHLPSPIAGYSARAMSPLFIGQNVTFNGKLDADQVVLWVSGPDGGRAHQVVLNLVDTSR
jgi:3-methylfumaryl-CoA hydratase